MDASLTECRRHVVPLQVQGDLLLHIKMPEPVVLHDRHAQLVDRWRLAQQRLEDPDLSLPLGSTDDEAAREERDAAVKDAETLGILKERRRVADEVRERYNAYRRPADVSGASAEGYNAAAGAMHELLRWLEGEE